MRMMSEHVEGRIAFLKTELKITDAQLPLWNSFAQAVRDNATAMQGMRGGMTGWARPPPFPTNWRRERRCCRGIWTPCASCKPQLNPFMPR